MAQKWLAPLTEYMIGSSPELCVSWPTVPKRITSYYDARLFGQLAACCEMIATIILLNFASTANAARWLESADFLYGRAACRAIDRIEEFKKMQGKLELIKMTTESISQFVAMATRAGTLFEALLK